MVFSSLPLGEQSLPLLGPGRRGSAFIMKSDPKSPKINRLPPSSSCPAAQRGGFIVIIVPFADSDDAPPDVGRGATGVQ
jgi:hypothetical protein